VSINHVTGRITIADFRAGIHSDFHAGTAAIATSGMSVNGAAVVEETWGCCADLSGALVPLPRVTTGKTSALIPSNASLHGTGLPGTYLLDAIVVDEVQQVNQPLSANPEVVTMQAFVYSPAGFWDQYMLVRRWHEFKASPDASDVSFVKSGASQAANELLSGNLCHTRGYEDSSYSATEEGAISSLRKGFAWVAHTLEVAGTLDGASSQFIQGAMTSGDQAISDYYSKYSQVQFSGNYPYRVRDAVVGYFPNFASPPNIFMNTPGHYDGSGTGNRHYQGAFMCTGHQGRVVVAQRIPSQYENRSSGLYAWKDRLTASAPLQPHVFGGGGEFVEEVTSGIGTMASLSADELLVVKHSGGGYLLRGSVTNPTVTKLPFIESTYGVVSSPVATPMGLVYGSRNGVFVWDGGQTSRHISPQLDGFFWRHTATKYQGHSARFGWWHPWVMAPNGFMFDTRNQGWWRLDNPNGHEAYNVYAVSNRDRLYAFPWRLGAASPANVVWNQADSDVLASQWSWKSQPLYETRDTAFKVRDVTILATAADIGSTVTVTVVGIDETGLLVSLVPVTFTLSDNLDQPQQLMKDASSPGAGALAYIQVKVVANNTNSLTAPKVHSVTLGVVDTVPIPKAS
jgi:hypothetical protein